MREAASQMIASGRKDILYFYNSASYSGRRKLAGYRAAMREAGLLRENGLLQFYTGSHEDIHAMAGQLEKVKSEGLFFNGVIAADDNLALGAVKYAQKNGLKIPEELSVIGYNNSLLTTCCDPELTSIDNKLETLCQHLTATLMGVLNGEKMPEEAVFSGEIIHRGTTLLQS